MPENVRTYLLSGMIHGHSGIGRAQTMLHVDLLLQWILAALSPGVICAYKP